MQPDAEQVLVEAERSVLGAMLQDPDAVPRVTPVLKADDFFHPRRGVIFEAIASIHASQRVSDPIAVADELNRHGRLEEVGGYAELLGSMDGVITAAEVDYHAEIVKKHAQRRRMADRLRRVQARIDQGADVDELKAELGNLANSTPGKSRARVRSWAEFQQQTDFQFLMAGWLPTKGVAVLGGAEHTGKSTLAVDWALRCVLGDAVEPWCGHAVRRPCSSVYVIGEDPQGIRLRIEAFVQERVAGEFGEQFAKTLSCEERTIDFVDRMPEPLAETAGIEELRRIVERFRFEHGHLPGIVWLDTSSTLYGGDENDNAAMGQFAKALSEIADEFDLLVVLIHHLRKPSGRPTRPSGADLRGAGSMSADFDVVMLMSQKNPDDKAASPIELFVHKGKNGGTTGTKHWLSSRWVSLRQTPDGDDVGAPIMVPTDQPIDQTDEQQHAEQVSNVTRIAFRMLRALRDNPDQPDWVRNQTAAEQLTHGKTKHKRQAWQLLVGHEWVTNTGKSRAPRWEVSDKAPPSSDPRFTDGDG